MLLGYFVSRFPIEPFAMCSLHVGADVYLPVTLPSEHGVQTVISTSKIESRLPIIRRRQRFFGLDGVHPVTTSTRIPILSP